ncbi:glyoxalase [Croceicoccus estronivorus]|uniref:VOC family protein n=1 Tax=Croceicoccus estronivorus TaxID=1172626 RepID=UPI00082F7B9B|nr:VOC family protein [Croceicoccus estronivorus]OCC25580.1 glyoxalase [Croceicoccus estronivorus]
MSMAKHGPIDQIGVLVDDLDAGIRHWKDVLGVGPWTVFRNVSMQGNYRGQDGVVMMDVAMGYQGETQIELIKVTNDAPSPYRDGTGAPIIGLHHLAWLVDDLDQTVADVTADGMTVIFQASNPGTRVAYCEIEGEPGPLFEFIEGAQTAELFKSGREATKTWDGSNPITEFDFTAM